MTKTRMETIRPSTASNSEGRLVETCMIHRYPDNTTEYYQDGSLFV